MIEHPKSRKRREEAKLTCEKHTFADYQKQKADQLYSDYDAYYYYGDYYITSSR